MFPPQAALFVPRVAPEHRHGCCFLNSRTPRRRHPAWAPTAAAAAAAAAAAPLSLTHAWPRPTPFGSSPQRKEEQRKKKRDLHLSLHCAQNPANHAKKQTLRFANGIAVPVELGKPDEAAALAALQESLKEWRIPSGDASAAAGAAPFVPSYVALDKKVRAAVGRRCDLKLASPAGIPEAALSFVWEGVVVSSLHHRRQAHPRDSTFHPQVLRYFAFFREPVPDSPLESWRVRKVQLLYYLEDGERGLVCGAQLRSCPKGRVSTPALGCLATALLPGSTLLPTLFPPAGSMQVTEPPEPNSGLVQGTLVRRHKIPHQGGGVLGLADLAVGVAVNIYGRCA